VIYENVHEDANVIFGALVDDDMEIEVRITVLATGFKSVGSDADQKDSSAPSSKDRSSNRSDIPDYLRSQVKRK